MKTQALENVIFSWQNLLNSGTISIKINTINPLVPEFFSKFWSTLDKLVIWEAKP